ncbi:retrovirus-related Pol polyprotein from transposon opus [Elysia marginata]|uniref:Retrovirus-related Pol polyprotein from transposon opus n=1 Tax=Elysia marginata TaxID=1093978 RepID=A0AAV4EDE6_9GAST|nr:retrovirus-related Pol polyprotein from transposon opus [Elysia marginata]
MASTGLTKKTQGHCIDPLFYKDRHYAQKLSLLPDLCADVILGHDFLGKHSEVCFPFDGPQDPLNILGVVAANIEAPSLFENLTEDCKPISTKSRRHSLLDERFIESEVQKLLKEEIIEPSLSPWRAQVLVTSGERHKKRLVIDCSQTINKYTLLDAYPLPRLDKMAETISRYKYYSTFDLKSAYDQIPLKERDKEYTAFEACGNLYHFKRIPFGVTNGVVIFQRTIDNIIKQEGLPACFAYLDNVTVCGDHLSEHDANVKLFREAARRHGLTFNEEKTS